MAPGTGDAGGLRATEADRADVVTALREAGCVFAEEEAEVLLREAHGALELARLVAGRAAGIPLEQLVGWVDFCGRRLVLDRGVFVPRRRTELLALTAARLLRPTDPVVELCCGSGAVARVLLDEADVPELLAVDLDERAVRCARRNLAGTAAVVLHGDLYAPLPARLRGRVGLVVANTPYVPTPDLGLLPHEAREHEPRLAHDGGADGLDVVRRVVAQAPSWLRPAGHLLVEVGEAQLAETTALVAEQGLAASVERSEAGGVVVVARASGAAAAPGRSTSRATPRPGATP